MVRLHAPGSRKQPRCGQEDHRMGVLYLRILLINGRFRALETTYRDQQPLQFPRLPVDEIELLAYARIERSSIHLKSC